MNVSTVFDIWLQFKFGFLVELVQFNRVNCWFRVELFSPQRPYVTRLFFPTETNVRPAEIFRSV